MKISTCQKKEKEYLTNSERETFLLAKKLARDFKGQEVVFLIGELGAGKTIFAKGIAAGLGLKDVHQVCSPTYTLINIYEAKYSIFHIDLYRLGENAEILDLGLEDYLGQGIIVVEWAEKMKFNLDAIRVILHIGKKDQRKITICF
ncbi:MAG TPA: tRNA (adenosine(37)-N6)-threonylcarbamoyltransferase complex ATPase subunit type 1 TsaE [Candidatus Aminicenantes bacterium]|nr:tRNA (adenosine(37)-N6)-threonylcarbamoyltransferase complex ATPase subunit type 1 TsaE [Candidatus Aminicenantes bacterium]HEB36482.1 tRNA (adenosine(37)-N6)-threonylcarbamoyltransferase complex ATPase subunit type 1 TsaE [Candidatus Aminicenantes bacterium]